MKLARLSPIFAAAFAVIYLVAVEFNLAAVTYHPKIGVWELLAQPGRDGPAMHWYGWLITALAGAAGVSAVSLPVFGRSDPPAWLGWAVPLAVIAMFFWLLSKFFFY